VYTALQTRPPVVTADGLVAVLPSLDEAAASTVDVAHPRVTEVATTTQTPGVLLDRHLMLAKFVSKLGTRLPIASTGTMKSLYQTIAWWAWLLHQLVT
jgi:hypothetical protein